MTRVFFNFFYVAGGDGYIIDQNAQGIRLNPQTQFLNVMEHNDEER
jgi:hypothetical protein